MLLDNAVSLAVDSTNVIVNLCGSSISPSNLHSVQGENCWTMPPHGRLTQQMSLTCSCLIGCSPPQTCRRFGKKTVRQRRSMRRFDCNLCPLFGRKIVFFCVLLVRRFALEKTSLTVSECHSLAPICAWEKHR